MILTVAETATFEGRRGFDRTACQIVSTVADRRSAASIAAQRNVAQRSAAAPNVTGREIADPMAHNAPGHPEALAMVATMRGRS